MIGAAAMYLLVREMRTLPLTVTVAAGAAAYTLSQVILRFATQDDVAIIRRVLRRQKRPLEGGTG
jgi:hypothetical protein